MNLPIPSAVPMRPWLLVISALLTVVAGCGGGGGKKDATDLLDKAFAHPIHSARLNLDGQLSVSGIEALRGPIRIQASGPVSGGARGAPRYDVDLKLGVGVGQTIDTGSLSTGRRSFVKFEDSWYELNPSQVRAGRRSREGARCRAGLDARSWISDARDDGTEKVGGVETTHVTGKLDVRRTIRGLSRYLARCGTAVGAARKLPAPLTGADLDRVSRLVRDPDFDIYVGKQDGLIHRVSARVDVRVPKAQRARAGGLSGASLQVSLDLADVNRPKAIQAPEASRPIAELSRRLGGAAALTDGLKGLGQEPPGGSALSGGQGTTTTPNQSTSTTGSGPSADAFKSYARCLDKADPENRVALQRCSRLLKGSR